ncbi:LD-carboxypeptidase [Nocardioides sp. GY 10127]|nr:LD-carboxypeptidase [Nocardioides sp. GY 10127]
MAARLRAAVEVVAARGYDVRLGECLLTDGDPVVSAPREARAAELMGMLLDPAVAAIVPPWGGELGIDLLPLLDWDALASAEPTWVVGYSDLTTLMLPLTTRLGWATLHGHNLMDTPYTVPDGLVGWLDVLEHDPADGPLTQTSPGRTRREGWDDYRGDPGVAVMTLDATTDWVTPSEGPLPGPFAGRLVGGCLETVAHLAGTPYGDVRGWAREHAPEGTVVLVEAAEHAALDVARALHGLRLAGWFEHANGVLVGRTPAPDSPAFTQADAVADALAGLRTPAGRDLPVVRDVDYGHTQPFASWVAGAWAEVDPAARVVSQTW